MEGQSGIEETGGGMTVIDGRKYTDVQFQEQRLSEKTDILEAAERMKSYWESHPEDYPDGSLASGEILDKAGVVS